MPLRRLSAAWLMVAATVLFALMGVCVKYASAHFSTPVIVLARGAVGAGVMVAIALAQRHTLATRVPLMHLGRGLAGTTALGLWFYAIGVLPLATAVTLNYMSSVWMAAFLLGAAWLGTGQRVDRRLVAAVLLGFAGVALVLRPTLERDQIGAGLVGLVSGMLAALAYLQVSALGKAGEPEVRVVFYFSLTSTVAGLLACAVFGFGPPALAAGGPWYAGLGWRAWAELFGVGLFATLAQLAMTRSYARGSALVNANLQYLGIVHAWLFGVWLFDDRITAGALAGMVLIVAAGMGAARLRPAAKAAGGRTAGAAGTAGAGHAAAPPDFRPSLPPDA